MRNFKNLFYFTILCFTAFKGLFSYAQNEEVNTMLQTHFSEVKISQEKIFNNETESVTMTIHNTTSFYVHNPKEFYIQKDTEFYIAEATNFISEAAENNQKNAIKKTIKNNPQIVLVAKNKENHYKKQAPRLAKLPANNTQNYANSQGIANKLATYQPVVKTKNIGYQIFKNHTLFATIISKNTINTYYSNPALVKYLQNKTPLYNKPPPFVG